MYGDVMADILTVHELSEFGPLGHVRGGGGGGGGVGIQTKAWANMLSFDNPEDR
jgi:hypothetical protein